MTKDDLEETRATEEEFDELVKDFIMNESLDRKIQAKNLGKDYVAICKETGKFYKKHWACTIVVYAICFLGIPGYLTYSNKRKKFQEPDLFKENFED